MSSSTLFLPFPTDQWVFFSRSRSFLWCVTQKFEKKNPTDPKDRVCPNLPTTVPQDTISGFPESFRDGRVAAALARDRPGSAKRSIIEVIGGLSRPSLAPFTASISIASGHMTTTTLVCGMLVFCALEERRCVASPLPSGSCFPGCMCVLLRLRCFQMTRSFQRIFVGAGTRAMLGRVFLDR